MPRTFSMPSRKSGASAFAGRTATLTTCGSSTKRLAVAFGASERFWLGLQADYDLEEARRALGSQVARIARVAA